MDLQSVCREVMDSVDGSLGCVLADVETGLPLAAEYRDGSVMDGHMITLVSYVGIDLFRGKLVRNFERSLSRDHGSSEGFGFVREVQLTTNTTYQFMSAVPGWDHVIFILITNRNVSLGMGLLAVHDAVRLLGKTSRHQAAAPAVDPTFRPPEDESEPSIPSPPQPSPPPPEPRGDITFNGTQREVAIRDRRPDSPQQSNTGDTGIEPQRPDRSAARVDRAPSAPAPHAGIPDGSAPKTSAREAAAPPASSIGDTRDAAAQTVDEPHSAPERYYRGARLEDSDTKESTPIAVPTGPRARMFFRRPQDDRQGKRRRRS